jgi:hypothetical protein
MRFTWIRSLGCAFIMACSSTDSTSTTVDAAAADGASPQADGGTTDDDGQAPPDSSAVACPPSPPVYVVTDSGFVSALDPATLKLTSVTLPRCTNPQNGFTSPFAVTHDARGWFVNFQFGGRGAQWFLLPMEAADGGCPRESFERAQGGDVITGITYGSVSAGAADETLFVVAGSGTSSFDLSTMSPSTGYITHRAPLPTAMWLAGTANGRLLGLMDPAGNVSTGPYAVSEIDPASGTVQQIGTVPGTGPVAFARGLLFVFASAPGGARGTTDLYTFDRAAKTATKRAHFDFVTGGAGASSCAAPM